MDKNRAIDIVCTIAEAHNAQPEAVQLVRSLARDTFTIEPVPADQPRLGIAHKSVMPVRGRDSLGFLEPLDEEGESEHKDIFADDEDEQLKEID